MSAWADAPMLTCQNKQHIHNFPTHSAEYGYVSRLGVIKSHWFRLNTKHSQAIGFAVFVLKIVCSNQLLDDNDLLVLLVESRFKCWCSKCDMFLKSSIHIHNKKRWTNGWENMFWETWKGSPLWCFYLVNGEAGPKDPGSPNLRMVKWNLNTKSVSEVMNDTPIIWRSVSQDP